MLSARDVVRRELGEDYSVVLAPFRRVVRTWASFLGAPVLDAPAQIVERQRADGLEVDEEQVAILVAAAVEEHEARESAEVRT